MTIETWKNKHGEGLPDGPWNDEPDKAVWVDEATNLDCMIHRNRYGALCGYVAVGHDHPLHKTSYSDLDDLGVDVHGGLTFAGDCDNSEDTPQFGICHIPAEGQPSDVWWFGFDCGHAFDLSPNFPGVWDADLDSAIVELVNGIQQSGPSKGDTYRTFEYTKGEVESLAKQLTEIGDK